MPKPILFAIAHQNPAFADALSIALQQNPEYHVAFTADSGPGIIEAFEKAITKPDILLFASDLCLDGCDVHLTLKTSVPHLRTLILGVYEDDEQAIRFIQQDAKAYVLQHRGIAEILAAARYVAEGAYYENDKMSIRKHIGRLRQPIELNAKQLQVMPKLALHEKMEAVASKVKMSPHSLARYRDKLYTRLNLHNRGQLLGFCIRYGIIKAGDLGRFDARYGLY